MDYQIITSDSGFIVYRHTHDFRDQTRIEFKFEVRFDRIFEIEAFKSDLLFADCICLNFLCSDGIVYTVHEKMDQFEKLKTAMESKFPIIAPDWLEKIVHLPFEENRTLLFTKL